MFDTRLRNGPSFLCMECDCSKLPKCLQMLTEAYQDVWTHGVETAEQCMAHRHFTQILLSDLCSTPFQGPDWVLREAPSLMPLPSLDPVLVSFLLLCKLGDDQEKKGWCFFVVWGILVSRLVSLVSAWDETVDDGKNVWEGRLVHFTTAGKQRENGRGQETK